MADWLGGTGNFSRRRHWLGAAVGLPFGQQLCESGAHNTFGGEAHVIVLRGEADQVALLLDAELVVETAADGLNRRGRQAEAPGRSGIVATVADDREDEVLGERETPARAVGRRQIGF